MAQWQYRSVRIGVEVRLHGNLIAKFRVPTYTTQITSWQWTLAGWNTNTTRSRINALVRQFGGPHPTTCKGQAHAQWIEFGRVVKRLPIAADEWVWCTPRESAPEWSEARAKAWADGRPWSGMGRP